jgi:anti-anti-sigma factor
MSAVQELAIDGELSIYRAAELRQWFDSSLQPGGAVQIDLAEVSEIDTAGAQLLIAARRLAQQRGCTLHYVHHSAPVLALLALFNLGTALGTST